MFFLNLKVWLVMKKWGPMLLIKTDLEVALPKAKKIQ